MKITKEWLAEKNACQDGYNWFTKQNKEFEPVPLLNLLIKKNQLDWTNWLVVRVMNYSQYVSYAVFAAELVIDIFEKEFPDDKRPRTAIEVAKKCIKNPSEENKKEAANAAREASSAANWAADWAADSAAWAAARAADSAADWAAYRAEDSAADWAACSAADSAADRSEYRAAKRAKMLKKILKYGIELLRGGK